MTVIDKSGRRHALRGVSGQNLAQGLAEHVETLGEEAVAQSPEGRGAVEAHVKVPNELLTKFPTPEGDDRRYLNELAESQDVDLHSRLASRITLDASMQGSLVALGDIRPWRSL